MRGHGEGSISKRADGRWEAKISLGYRGGKRLRKAFYGPTRADVQRKLREALKARDDGLPLGTDDRLTVEAYLQRWYAATEPNVRPKTRKHFRWCMAHLIDGLGHHPLKQLQPHDLQIFLNRKARSMSTQSVHHFRATLRLSLNYAMREGLLARNVATLVDVPEMDRPEIHPLTAEQARVLIERWREDQHGALYVTALLLGLRQGEALGLRWSDFEGIEKAPLGRGTDSRRIAAYASSSAGPNPVTSDDGGAILNAGPIRGRRAANPPDLDSMIGSYHPSGSLTTPRVSVTKTATARTTKTRASVRKLTIPPTLVAILREHRASQVRSIEGYVFPNQRGGPLDGTNVTHRFQRFCRAVGLPHISFHTLRHSYASLALQSGVSLKEVSTMLGHASITLTADTYAHLAPVQYDDAAAKLEALLAR